MSVARFRGRRLQAGVVALALLAGLLALVSGGGGRQRAAVSAGAPPPGGGVVRATRGAAPAGAAAAAQTGAVDRVLAYTSYVATGSPRRRDIALTFDDGPGPATLGVLGALRRARAIATFFEVGRAARRYPAIERSVVAAGQAIGDHTATHRLLSRMPRAAQQAEIANGARDITRRGAPYPRLFRPPYGAFNRDTLGVLRGQRMLMVLWTVDTRDFSRPGVARIVYSAVSGARPGAIILFHDGGGDRSQTVAALPRIITLLRRRHYNLVSVARLLVDDPPPRGQPPPRSLAGA